MSPSLSADPLEGSCLFSLDGFCLWWRVALQGCTVQVHKYPSLQSVEDAASQGSKLRMSWNITIWEPKGHCRIEISMCSIILNLVSVVTQRGDHVCTGNMIILWSPLNGLQTADSDNLRMLTNKAAVFWSRGWCSKLAASLSYCDLASGSLVSQLAAGSLTRECGTGEGKRKYLGTERHAREVTEGKAAPGKGQ